MSATADIGVGERLPQSPSGVGEDRRGRHRGEGTATAVVVGGGGGPPQSPSEVGEYRCIRRMQGRATVSAARIGDGAAAGQSSVCVSGVGKDGPRRRRRGPCTRLRMPDPDPCAKGRRFRRWGRRFEVAGGEGEGAAAVGKLEEPAAAAIGGGRERRRWERQHRLELLCPWIRPPPSSWTGCRRHRWCGVAGARALRGKAAASIIIAKREK